jgi:hypothetical protein
MLRQRTMRAARRTRQTGNRERRAESGAGHGPACCNQNPEPRFPAPSSGSPSSVWPAEANRGRILLVYDLGRHLDGLKCGIRFRNELEGE